MRKKIFSARIHFLDLVFQSETDECILWPFAVRKSSGYGAYNEGSGKNKKNWDIHRYVCLQVHGEPEPMEEAAHRCGKKLCINPRHLYWSDRVGNMNDAIEHKVLRGGGRYRQRIFPKDIRDMVSSTASHIALSRVYEVRPNYIGTLRRRAHWRRATRVIEYDL